MKIQILVYTGEKPPAIKLTETALATLKKNPNQLMMVEDTTGGKHVVKLIP